jgi:nucleoside-diphosphate-sugar epimerase
MSHRVLVSGANGFLAQRILTVFLEAGHSVRGTVRTQAKADQLAKTFHASVSAKKLDFAIVPDIAAPGAFDAALESTPPFDLVIHSASPFNYRLNTKNAEFLEPAVKGTTGILQSIKAHGPNVKRVVLTGSMAAIIDFTAPKWTHPPKVYTEADWNPVKWDVALVTDNINAVYQASKKYAEQSAWDFVSDTKPSFDLAVINPPMIMGPMVDPSIYSKPTDLPESLYGIYKNLLQPGLAEDSPMPTGGLHLYADVRDVAQAHYLAATIPEAGGHRFVICAGQGGMAPQHIANILREKMPELRSRIPRGDPDTWAMDNGAFEGSSKLAEEILGIKFRPAEVTIGDLGPQLIEVEKKGESSEH